MPLTLVPLNGPGRLLLAEHPEYTEAGLIKIFRDTDTLRSDLDQLARRVDALLRERSQIAETLATFYRAETQLHQAQTILAHIRAVLDLALALNPTLAEAEQLRLTETTEPR